ncbi:MAG: secretin N-terminal domain-containing protein [Planctomycetaceae bacterium]
MGPGPGGFGGPGNSTVSTELRRGTVREELGLSEDQSRALDELLNTSANGDVFREYMGRLREAKSPEERTALQQELQDSMARREQETSARIEEILKPEQYKRARQIVLHRAGTQALAEPEVADGLGLSTEQQQQLQQLNDARMFARQELGFRPTPEQLAAFRTEWDAKVFAVLDDEQRGKFDELRGAPPADDPSATAAANAPVPRTTASTPAAASPATLNNAVGPGSAPAPIDTPNESGVISSFGGSSAEVANRSAEEARYSFNFRYAPWSEVLKLFATQAGLTADLDVVPPGTFSYFDDGVYTMTQALDILNGYLLPKGYVLIRRDRFLVCLAIDGNPIPPNNIPYVPLSELPQRGRNEMMTVIFPLEGADINAAAAEVTNLIGPQGKVVGLKTTNSLVVTDIGDNLLRIQGLLKDIAAGPQDAVFRSYTLQYIAVDEAETMVRSLLGLATGAQDVSAGSGSEGRGGFDPRMFERMREMARSGGGGGPVTPISADPQITSNVRTNSLLVSATPAQQKIVEEALAVIDVEEEESTFYSRSRKPYLQVYEVSTSDPREVVKTLQVLVPGVVVNEDGRNGKIHILATEDQHREVALLVRQLDGQGSGDQIIVIPLVKMDPISAAATLRSMFIADGEAAPTIEPDLYGRQVMIRGTSSQIAQAQQLLLNLGEDGTGQRRPGEGGMLRNLPLSGRDPEEFLPLLQRTFEAGSKTQIRIVRPQDRGPIKDIRTPNPQPSSQDELRREDSGPSAQLQPSGRRGVPVQFAAQTEVVPNDGTVPAAPAASSPEQPQSFSNDEFDAILDVLGRGTGGTSEAGGAAGTSGVTMMLLGDELVVSGADPEELDRLESLYESLMQAIPPRNSWTIYPLEHSDVLTTAGMLQQLFPESDVLTSDSVGSSGGMMSSLTGGLDSLTSSLGSISGLSGTSAGRLQMIPYPTDNALFVSGPSHKVAEVEQMLQILDSGELSASLRDRTPRSITVQYADVDQVATIVRDLYKDYLDNEQDRGARNAANMFAQMMGGGGRGGQQQQQSQPAAQLAIGVDRQTSQIIVSANEQLFREVEDLIISIDESARDSRPTVRVITLQQTSPKQVMGTLGTLMPRVKVSSTGSAPASSSGSSNSSGGSSSSSGGDSGGNRPDPEAFRRMFEERARQQQGNTGGGAAPSGGGASPFGGRGGFGGFGGGRSGRGR